jgi:chemotaxis protein CheX
VGGGGPVVDVSYINPFVEAVGSVFETMLGVHPKRNGVKVSSHEGAGPRLTSMIGITGSMHGCVALCFPPPTALSLAGRMLGAEAATVNDEVIDAISEMVNMVAGSAKAKFNSDPPLQLGLPTVVEGSGYRVKYPSKSIWLEVPFNSEAGEFSMEVTYAPNRG